MPQLLPFFLDSSDLFSSFLTFKSSFVRINRISGSAASDILYDRHECLLRSAFSY